MKQKLRWATSRDHLFDYDFSEEAAQKQRQYYFYSDISITSIEQKRYGHSEPHHAIVAHLREDDHPAVQAPLVHSLDIENDPLVHPLKFVYHLFSSPFSYFLNHSTL